MLVYRVEHPETHFGPYNHEDYGNENLSDIERLFKMLLPNEDGEEPLGSRMGSAHSNM